MQPQNMSGATMKVAGYNQRVPTSNLAYDPVTQSYSPIITKPTPQISNSQLIKSEHTSINNNVVPASLQQIKKYPLPSQATGHRVSSGSSSGGNKENRGFDSASISSMKLGEVRKCLNQIRKAGDRLRPEHLLFNGWSAGAFALAYLIGHHKRRVMGYQDASQTKGGASVPRYPILTSNSSKQQMNEDDVLAEALGYS